GPEPCGEPVACLAFRPDGRALAGGGAGGLFLWDLGSGRLRALRGESDREVTCVAFYPGGRSLAVVNDGRLTRRDSRGAVRWRAAPWGGGRAGGGGVGYEAGPSPGVPLGRAGKTRASSSSPMPNHPGRVREGPRVPPRLWDVPPAPEDP